ncbi:hypothetical protein PoB_002365700 [Plakobranchus ocellatus]|uniref:Uncharacterized protein n=1 Tax=Plakobranchus ocellatus TaxID=259542 RepID=A0AAV3ZR69_9GAST|nr:hypothetical protein PoB_002365700 [Plakobranchus ocellatus]
MSELLLVSSSLWNFSRKSDIDVMMTGPGIVPVFGPDLASGKTWSGARAAHIRPVEPLKIYLNIMAAISNDWNTCTSKSTLALQTVPRSYVKLGIEIRVYGDLNLSVLEHENQALNLEPLPFHAKVLQSFNESEWP